MKQVVKILASAIGFTALGLGGGLLSILGLPLLWLFPGGRVKLRWRTRWIIHRFFRATVSLLSWTDCFKVRSEGLPPRDQLNGRLILATHPSYLDVVVLLSLFEQMTCVVKGDIWNNLLFGLVVRAAGYIPALDPARVMEEGALALARGEALLLFPEGTRTLPGKPRPYVFQRGAARLALQARARIQPIFISCEPSLLAKGQRWHEIPPVSCDYHIRAVPPLDLPWPALTELSQSQAARKVTAWLENRFNQERSMIQDISPLEMKRFIVKTLDLENTAPDDIGDDQSLFAGGLGLDSIDAFELGIALKKAYSLNLDGEKTSSFAHHFRTPATLAHFVATFRQVSP